MLLWFPRLFDIQNIWAVRVRFSFPSAACRAGEGVSGPPFGFLLAERAAGASRSFKTSKHPQQIAELHF
jgi:hypothetical protein